MTGRYKKYPEYLDSGIEWLKEMPAHWKLVKAKNIFKRVQRPVQPENGIITAFRDGEVTLRSKRRTDGFTNAVKEIGYQGVRKGDLLVHAMDGFAGAIGISDSDGKCSPVCSVCIPWNKDLIDTSYYGYLVRQLAVTDYITSLAKGIRERSTEFRYSEFSNLFLAVPSQEEQQNIANFLDHETAKIDTLITKQEKLIELLKEKRQAVISHAVTKGLNPDAPMKDSGVEWLGEVPEHWAIPRIKQVVSTPITDGPHETPKFVDQGVPFVSAEAVSKGVVNFNKIRGFITEKQNAIYSMKYSPKIYDIYMVKSGATTGVTAIVETNKIFNIWSPLAVIRSKNSIHPYFVLNFMRSHEFQKAIELNWNFGTQQNIGMGVIGNLHIACPPLSEAIEIASFLNDKIDKYNKIIEKANKGISLIKERKIALISSAVTGKIDVRNYEAIEQELSNG
ncbi:restriction endonuclease subunit S [Psychromonas ossibalaenae]|uniref:restriction endonuclease subunit S n=1 Tax=Psychromonas ossibalaenae TaxID=444922 RepID=UPI00037FA3B3|nr:restriction endonuclease subunit S [Psychromonas ossibalaenae]